MQHRSTNLVDVVFAGRHRHGIRRERRIQLVCNPADDATFAALAEGFLASGVATPDGLQRLLAERYPRVVVRARGLANEEFDAWYVYREGAWIRSGTTASS